MRKLTISQILVNVWQRNITPEEALEELERSGHKPRISKAKVMEMLEEVAAKTMNVTAFLRAAGEER